MQQTQTGTLGMEPQEYAKVEIPGRPLLCIPFVALPAAGTQFVVHKHLTEDGTQIKLEVTSLEWTLEEPATDDSSAYFSVTVHTRRVD